MKPHLLLCAAALLAAVAPVRAVIVTETYGPLTPGTLLADNQPVLTPSLQSVNISAILALTKVELTLDLRGPTEGAGFANDLFASLLKSPLGVTPTGSDPAAVLLNRVGGTGGSPAGFGYDGWSVTFSDGAAGGDIHTASLVSGILSGSFEPDGRLLPNDTLRPAMLGVFTGGAGNGDWRLNLGDLAANGTMRLNSWTLTLTGENGAAAIPEPATWAAGLALLGLVGATWWRRGRVSQ